jgi:DNA-binding response OmpR family regulator
LLLADDSAAVQKVIELTFADEGMEVVSVGDGQTALEKLESVTPDVVLADAFMPGLNGYDLCRSMKGDHRFAQIPVMLLVSSFAPFDEAEAHRAGADDIMTKPFQSIRQLVSRVDSLLSSTGPKVASATNRPTDDAIHFESHEPIPVEVEPDEPKVTVMVEAAQMEAALPHELPTGGACAPDIEFQTADTARLEPTLHEAAAEISEDTLEVKPQFDHSRVYKTVAEVLPAPVFSNTRDKSMNETITSNEPTRSRFSDSLLDLDEAEFGGSAIADEVILDLDLDEPTAVDYQPSPWTDQKVEPVEVVAEAEPVVPVEAQEPSPIVADTTDDQADQVGTVASGAAGGAELSADAINAIARRVIEQMSDKVVREIAWEVVPELSELMIKKKLDQG